ncbi:MAG: polyprenyl synthetase family protein [Clostridia bacterium]|nr:polyprenyl synthetase family protein [Clostridia bacterium]
MEKYANIVIEDILRDKAEKIERALETYMMENYTGTTVTADAMRYALLGGGKRIRAFLVLEFCKLFGGSEEAAMPFACALECIHAYSLVHDDLPCMDDDDLRRGKPSCHKKFGEAEALLAGDALLTLAFELCASNTYVSHKSVRLAVTTLAHEAGAVGMVGGQTLDLANQVESYQDLRTIYRKKTSALISAACLLGYFAAVDKPVQKDIQNLRLYADAVGLAFQIHDDVLDVKSDTATLGKTVGSDEKNNKKTVLAFMSLKEAEEEEALLTLLAVEAISAYENSDVLCKLAIWLLARKK